MNLVFFQIAVPSNLINHADFLKRNRFTFFFLLICRDLSYGKGSTAPLRSAKLPKLNAREPWDGKDAEVIAFAFPYLPLSFSLKSKHWCNYWK